MRGTWRSAAAPIIASVIDRVGTDDMQTLKAALREAYPFGERRHHPYKIWCDEIRSQLKLKRPKARPICQGQLSLFGD